VHRDVETNGQ